MIRTLNIVCCKKVFSGIKLIHVLYSINRQLLSNTPKEYKEHGVLILGSFPDFYLMRCIFTKLIFLISATTPLLGHGGLESKVGFLPSFCLFVCQFLGMMKIRVHDKRNGGEIQPIVNIVSHKLALGTEHDQRSALQLFHLLTLTDLHYFSLNIFSRCEAKEDHK